MSIVISQIKNHYVSVDQYMYDTYVVENYLYTDKLKENSKFHKPTLPHDMVFTKQDSSTSDKK